MEVYMRIINSQLQEKVVSCNCCKAKLAYTDNDITRSKDSFGIEYEDSIKCIACGNIIIVGAGYVED